MSILIKGIDMPKDHVLRIEIEPNGTVWEEGRDWIKHRQSAIQIPTPHGRLIDADRFIEDLRYDIDMDRTRLITDEDEDARFDAECKDNCISFIESACTPTILEAEE